MAPLIKCYVFSSIDNGIFNEDYTIKKVWQKYIFKIQANYLGPGEELHFGQFLISNNKCFMAAFGNEGNLYIKQLSTGTQLWSSDNFGNNPWKVRLGLHMFG